MTFNIVSLVYALYSSHVWCPCYLFIETTLTDDNCTSEWVRYDNLAALGSRQHLSATTLVECQTACYFDPRCAFVDWWSSNKWCWINIISNHRHFTASNLQHHELVSRCNITSGQCSENRLLFFFDSVYLNFLKCIQNFSNTLTADSNQLKTDYEDTFDEVELSNISVESFYRAMLCRAWLCHSMSSVRPSVCPWRSGTVITYVGILRK